MARLPAIKGTPAQRREIRAERRRMNRDLHFCERAAAAPDSAKPLTLPVTVSDRRRDARQTAAAGKIRGQRARVTRAREATASADLREAPGGHDA